MSVAIVENRYYDDLRLQMWCAHAGDNVVAVKLHLNHDPLAYHYLEIKDNDKPHMEWMFMLDHRTTVTDLRRLLDSFNNGQSFEYISAELWLFCITHHTVMRLINYIC